MNSENIFKKEMNAAGWDVEIDGVTRKPMVRVSLRELPDLEKLCAACDPPIQIVIKRFPKFAQVFPK